MSKQQKQQVTEQQPPEAPKPPDIERKAKFQKTQAIGVPILALLPVLAIFKLFDTRTTEAVSTAGPLEMRVRYPSLFRNETNSPFTIQVTNRGAGPLSSVEVSLSRNYVDRFADPTFFPEPDQITAGALQFQIESLEPGETRRIEARFKAKRAGSHQGFVGIDGKAAGATRVNFSTFAFP